MAKVIGALVVTGLVLAGFALAGTSKDTISLTASLKARSEVPSPKGVPSGAAGVFSGKAVEQGSNRARITWRLTFSKLSGRATSAHIHVGRVGKAGNVMVPLCGPCTNGQRGAATITHAQLQTIRAGGAYVNIHTVRNAAGEIRGQVKATGGSTEPPPSSPPPPTSPPPPIYPP